MILKPVLRGLLTYVPAAEARMAKSTRGTNSARYCFSVWLRHLVMAHESRLVRGEAPVPGVVAELGPGDSLGIGLAALLTGARHYVALDLVAYANPERNLAVLDELVTLLQTRAPVPDASEFPSVKPFLPSYEFPRRILSDEHLARALSPERVASIRRALGDVDAPGGAVAYRAPWTDASVVERDSVDMLYSQAVLEHVDDLETAYTAMASWVKPGGFVSHEIAFSAHQLTPEWNGHWTISDPVWKLIRGKRPYLLNREPASTHLHLLKRSGLQIVNEVRVRVKSDIARERLARRFRYMHDDDLSTQAMFVQATKPAAST
jgi:hypothetical protein